MAFVLAYSIFNMSYILGGGTDINGNTRIYGVIDWLNKPVLAFFMGLGSYCVICAIHVSLWALTKARDKVWLTKMGGHFEKEELAGHELEESSPSITV